MPVTQTRNRAGWRGVPGPYSGTMPGEGPAGGGLSVSWLGQSAPGGVLPGEAGGGGHVPSLEPVLTGYGGCGGPGPDGLT